MTTITPIVQEATVVRETYVGPQVVGIEKGDRVVALLGETRIVGTVYSTTVTTFNNVGVALTIDGTDTAQYLWLDAGWTFESAAVLEAVAA